MGQEDGHKSLGKYYFCPLLNFVIACCVILANATFADYSLLTTNSAVEAYFRNHA